MLYGCNNIAKKYLIDSGRRAIWESPACKLQPHQNMTRSRQWIGQALSSSSSSFATARCLRHQWLRRLEGAQWIQGSRSLATVSSCSKFLIAAARSNGAARRPWPCSRCSSPSSFSTTAPNRDNQEDGTARRSFRGQLIESANRRVERERAEQRRFANERYGSQVGGRGGGAGAGGARGGEDADYQRPTRSGRAAALTFGKKSISGLIEGRAP